MTTRFHLDGREVEAGHGETIWEVARREGTTIPHLCHRPEPGYRPDGNCRACMVEIEGERVLAAACVRQPAPGMTVRTASDRAVASRRLVMELLLADGPTRERSPDRNAPIWAWAERQGVEESRFSLAPLPHAEAPAAGGPRSTHRAPAASEIPGTPVEAPPRGAPQGEGGSRDLSHPAMAVNLEACISCTLCARACREVQVNDVIGMAWSAQAHLPVFDLADPMGASTCVACGECVQACPTGALMPASIVDRETGEGARGAERSVDSVCPYCGVGCQLSFKVRDGRVAYVEGRDGPANENRLCVKGRFGFDYIASPQRLTVPLIRREGAPKGMNVDPAAPLTHFREATWEEALDAAAGGLARLREAHGGRAVAGFGSAKASNEEAYLFQKLIRTAFRHNNVDHCTRLCHASSVAALMEGIGSGAVTAPFTEALNADVIVVIGANPTENHPVAATYFKQAVKNGATLVVMDPRGQALKRHATHMLQFRPGADVALLNGIMHVIVTEELYDRQYIQAQTEGFERLREHLSAFPPEAVAPVCGIDPDTIRAVARSYARAERAIVFWGMGVSQHAHGTDNARCLISLALMCGHVGRPGTGLHPLRGQNNVQGASDAGLIPMFLPDYRSVGSDDRRAPFEALWGVEVDPEPGLTVVEIMDAIGRREIRGLYVMGENPAMSDPDLNHARAALASLDHLVVQDIFLTETAMFADVVLPAAAWPEKDGTATNTNRQVQMGRKAVDAPGAARPDWWVTQEIARRLGLAWTYAHPSEIFAEMKRVMPSLDNITWERLEREGSVTYPCPAPDAPGHGIVFGDRFPREGGRGLLVPAAITPPAETPDADFPFVLTTGRQLEHWHTGAMTRRAPVLDALEPAPTASLHPDALARLGVEAGEPIRVTTRRGTVALTARADPAMQPDMVFIPFAYVEAAANLLTIPQLDPMGKIPEFKVCAARVERAALSLSPGGGGWPREAGSGEGGA